MKKVLLIGELSEIVRSLNECLEEDFAVQISLAQLENVQAMVKIIRPDLIMICEIGNQETDNVMLGWIQEKCPQTPVLVITTEESYKQSRMFYDTQQFDVMFRPVAKTELLERCYMLLGGGYSQENGRKPVLQAGDERKRKIMIVDDSALLLRSMKRMLENYYAVCLAKSGEQALKMIPKENPDLILLDYEMEGMDGRCTFEAIREDEAMQSIPVVFLTSVADRASIYSVLKSKPDGYILKPPDEERILGTIREIFEKRQ